MAYCKFDNVQSGLITNTSPTLQLSQFVLIQDVTPLVQLTDILDLNFLTPRTLSYTICIYTSSDVTFFVNSVHSAVPGEERLNGSAVQSKPLT